MYENKINSFRYGNEEGFCVIQYNVAKIFCTNQLHRSLDRTNVN